MAAAMWASFTVATAPWALKGARILGRWGPHGRSTRLKEHTSRLLLAARLTKCASSVGHTNAARERDCKISRSFVRRAKAIVSCCCNSQQVAFARLVRWLAAANIRQRQSKTLEECEAKPPKPRRSSKRRSRRGKQRTDSNVLACLSALRACEGPSGSVACQPWHAAAACEDRARAAARLRHQPGCRSAHAL